MPTSHCHSLIIARAFVKIAVPDTQNVRSTADIGDPFLTDKCEAHGFFSWVGTGRSLREIFSLSRLVDLKTRTLSKMIVPCPINPRPSLPAINFTTFQNAELISRLGETQTSGCIPKASKLYAKPLCHRPSERCYALLHTAFIRQYPTSCSKIIASGNDT